MKEFISYTQLVFNISYLSNDNLIYYENTAHIVRYWNNIKLAKETFPSPSFFYHLQNWKINLKMWQDLTLPCFLLVQQVYRYIFIVQQVFRKTQCDYGFLPWKCLLCDYWFRNLKFISQGNTINTLNNAIPEKDKNKQLHRTTVITHITSSILVPWENPSLPPRRM